MLLAIILLFFLFNPHIASAIDFQQTESVNVSASIGENEVTIFGYTSPDSKVELTGINIYTMTYSNSDGYFVFNKTILPKLPGELCLQSTDLNGLKNTPTCFPPPPDTNYHTDIGPIILPPTISINNSSVKPNSSTISSGQSIPNSTINISFYKVNDSAKSFPQAALAYSLPILKTTTDINGNYSFNLPTAYASDYRFYTSVEYNSQPSPKSNTLFYLMPHYQSYLIFIIPIIICILLLILVFNFFKSPIQKQLALRLLPATRNFYPAIRKSFYPDTIPRSTRIPR